MIVFIVADMLPPRTATSVIAQMAFQLGSGHPELHGASVLEIEANAILTAPAERIRSIAEVTRRRGAALADVPDLDRDLVAAAKSIEYVAEMDWRCIPGEKITYWGVAIYGDRQILHRLTREFDQWQGPAAPPR
jgi:hypothetical protein